MDWLMGFVGAWGAWCLAMVLGTRWGRHKHRLGDLLGAAVGMGVGWAFADVWWGIRDVWRGAEIVWNAVVHGRWRRGRYPSLYWQIESSEVRELRLRLERDVREADRLARPGIDYMFSESRIMRVEGYWWHELKCSKAPCTCRKTQS